MAIEIYAYEPALFPAIESSLKLHAVAPLEFRQSVEVWCSARNKEAEDAGVRRRYKFQVTAVEIWE